MTWVYKRPARSALGAETYCPTLNLFRSRSTPDLLYAVPEDDPVPGFIEASTWMFAGTAAGYSRGLAGVTASVMEGLMRFSLVPFAYVPSYASQEADLTDQLCPTHLLSQTKDILAALADRAVRDEIGRDQARSVAPELLGEAV